MLNAWKQLLDSQQPAVFAALDTTDWRSRVHLSFSHPKQLVTGTASKLLPVCNGQELDAAEAQACLTAMQVCVCVVT